MFFCTFSTLLITAILLFGECYMLTSLIFKNKINVTYFLNPYFKLFSTSSINNFYESIGNPKFISAPMVDQSSTCWRLLVRKYGAELAYTPMINAGIFVRSQKYRTEQTDWLDNQIPSSQDKPLIAQLAGDSADTLIEAGKYIEDTVAAIDLNLGCPQNIAKRGHYGAHLLYSSPKLVIQIVSQMVKSLNCPITVKIRKYCNDVDTINLCKEFEQIGVSMITIHGRTIDSTKQFTGPTDWNIIRQVQEICSIPIIANGGISNYNDAIKCLEFTKANGVMSSEGLLENPKLFQSFDLNSSNYVSNQLEISYELLDLFAIHYNKTNDKKILSYLRGHLFKILFKILNYPSHHDMRTKLATCNDISDVKDMLDTINHRYNYYVKNNNNLNNFITDVSWYNRHRDELGNSKYILSKDKRQSYNNVNVILR